MLIDERHRSPHRIPSGLLVRYHGAMPVSNQPDDDLLAQMREDEYVELLQRVRELEIDGDDPVDR